MTICKCSQSTCVLKSDFNRWVSSTCPWMLDLHSRRPGRAANTSRSLCLQRPGRKHAPNLPLLYTPPKDNRNQHSTKNKTPKDTQEEQSRLHFNKERWAACVRTDTQIMRDILQTHLPLARFGAQLLDLLFLSAEKQGSLLRGHQQYLVTVFHLNHT